MRYGRVAAALSLMAGLFISACAEVQPTRGLLSARSMTEQEYLAQAPPVFHELYGPMAEPAAKSIWQQAGPVFAMDAQRAYRDVWGLKGPVSVNERSLATVAALVALDLYPQIKLHINGFLSSGGTLAQLCSFVGIAADEAKVSHKARLVEAVIAGLQWRAQAVGDLKTPSVAEVRRLMRKRSAVTDRQALLARFAADVARGDMVRLRKNMAALAEGLPSDASRDRYIDNLITHLVVYCGYPRGYNAFIEWQKLRQE